MCSKSWWRMCVLLHLTFLPLRLRVSCRSDLRGRCSCGCRSFWHSSNRVCFFELSFRNTLYMPLCGKSAFACRYWSTRAKGRRVVILARGHCDYDGCRQTYSSITYRLSVDDISISLLWVYNCYTCYCHSKSVLVVVLLIPCSSINTSWLSVRFFQCNLVRRRDIICLA